MQEFDISLGVESFRSQMFTGPRGCSGTERGSERHPCALNAKTSHQPRSDGTREDEGQAGSGIASLTTCVLGRCSAWRLLRWQRACPRQCSWNTAREAGGGGPQSGAAVPKESLNSSSHPIWASRPRSAQEPPQPLGAPHSPQTHGTSLVSATDGQPGVFLP